MTRQEIQILVQSEMQKALQESRMYLEYRMTVCASTLIESLAKKVEQETKINKETS